MNFSARLIIYSEKTQTVRSAEANDEQCEAFHEMGASLQRIVRYDVETGNFVFKDQEDANGHQCFCPLNAAGP